MQQDPKAKAKRLWFLNDHLADLAAGQRLAWTAAGVAQLREHTRPMGECDRLEDLWRGRLHAELEVLAAVDAQLRVMEASSTSWPSRTRR